MIEAVNASKVASNGGEEYIDVKKYIGVASIKVLALNPNNATLRSLGWTIPEDANEPNYIYKDADGKYSGTQLRFIAQIQDMEDKPVISLTFWVRPEIRYNSDKSKVVIIDKYGRTAYATQEEYNAGEIPQYSKGPANISKPYLPCHEGEEELVLFLMKLLNVTPLTRIDRLTGNWVDNANPGSLTIDDWKTLCKGDVSEVKGYLKMQPENCVKVILGVRVKQDNKSYQTFLNTRYIGNGAGPARDSGEYPSAVQAIGKFMDSHPNTASQYLFSAAPVKEWKLEATEVKDNSETFSPSVEKEEDLPF